jgi:polysaccharide export outer membrane protein
MAMKTATFTAFSFLILLSPAFAQDARRVNSPASPSSSPATPSSSAATPSSPKPSTDTVVAPDYRMFPGDKLRIEVYKDQQLSQSLQIRPDGKITLPFLGDVVAAGQTPIQLRDSLTTALKEYMTNPVVTVIVVESTPQSVYVMGEVKSSGPLTLKGPLSIMQAIAMAGGFTEFANKKDIRIQRQTGTGLKTLTFNYKEALENNRAPLLLQAGDVVVVK